MSAVNRIKWAVVLWVGLSLCSACALLTKRHLNHVQEAAEIAAQSLECVDQSMGESGETGEESDAPKPDMGE